MGGLTRVCRGGWIDWCVGAGGLTRVCRGGWIDSSV